MPIDTRTVHCIAYLTLHGWELEKNRWSKPGFETTRVEVDTCGSCTSRRVVTELTLAEAYRLQRDAVLKETD